MWTLELIIGVIAYVGKGSDLRKVGLCGSESVLSIHPAPLRAYLTATGLSEGLLIYGDGPARPRAIDLDKVEGQIWVVGLNPGGSNVDLSAEVAGLVDWMRSRLLPAWFGAACS